MTNAEAAGRAEHARAAPTIRAWIVIAALTAITAGSWHPAPAQDRIRLKADVATRFKQYRSGGPLPLEVTLRWSGTAVLEGRLDIRVGDRARTLSQIQTPDLAVAPGATTFPVLLPPPAPADLGGQGFVDLTFIGKKGELDLGRFKVVLADAESRSLVIGLVQTAGSQQPGLRRLANKLRLERFDPDRANPDRTQRLTTGLVDVPVRDLPREPLALCAYDLMVIDSEGLVELREKQLEGLLAWIRAGGAALVRTDQASSLKPHHVAFLNALVDAPTPDYALDPDGRLLGQAAISPEWRHVHPELGRAVIVHGPLDLDGDARSGTELDRAVVFLWKVRYSAGKRMIDTGRWPPLRVSSEVLEPTTGFAWHPLTFDLSSIVLPAEIQLIPLGVLALILGLFLLCIGPLDYLVLGLFRVRWLTWIVFPLTCVAFTMVTVGVANRYLGHTDHQCSLIFADVGARGQVLRENRYNLIFSGAQRREVRQEKDSLFAVVSPAWFAAEEMYMCSWAARRRWSPTATGQENPPRITGRLTGWYEMRRLIWKWTPMAERTTRLAPGGSAPELDRVAFDPRALPQGLSRDTEACAHLVQILCGRAGLDPDDVVLVQVLHGEHTVVLHETEITSRQDDEERGLTTKKLRELIDKVSRRSHKTGFFTLVSAISPTGSGDFEDLAVLDPDNGEQALLAIVVRQGQDLVVYRRFLWK